MFLAAPLEETRTALQSKCSKLDDALQHHAVTRNPATLCISLSSPPTKGACDGHTAGMQKNKEFLEKQLIEMGKNLEVRAMIETRSRPLAPIGGLCGCQELMAAQQE
jgi:hypothetical protein